MAITILGWLYGGDDFGRSLCIAAGCGEDADCTGATLGAVLGIIRGYDGIPQKWIEPLGKSIKTVALNLGDRDIVVPKTVDELTERVICMTPIFLGSRYCDTIYAEKGYYLDMNEPSQLYNHPWKINSYAAYRFEDLLARQPFSVSYDFTLFNATLDYGGEPYVKEGETRKFKLSLENNMHIQQWITICWYLPEGWRIIPSVETCFSLEQYHGNIGRAVKEFVLTPSELNRAKYDIVLEISSNGRHSKGLIPIVLLNA